MRIEINTTRTPMPEAETLTLNEIMSEVGIYQPLKSAPDIRLVTLPGLVTLFVSGDNVMEVDRDVWFTEKFVRIKDEILTIKLIG